MVFLRAKLKVRYALLIFTVSILTYISLRRGFNVNEILRRSQLLPEETIKAAEVIRRSLSPAWPEGRELLNEVPRTHRTQNLNKPFSDFENKTEDALQKLPESDSMEIKQSVLIHKPNTFLPERVENKKSDIILKERKDFHIFQTRIEKNVTKIQEDNKNELFRPLLQVHTAVPPFSTSKIRHDDAKNNFYSTLIPKNSEFFQQQSNAANSQNSNNVTLENNRRRHVSAKNNATHHSKKKLEFSQSDNSSISNSSSKNYNRTIFLPLDGKIVYYDRSTMNYKLEYQKRTEHKSSWRQVAGNLPLTPKEAIARFGNKVPWWEQYEMRNYPEIWYLGLHANKSTFVNNAKNNFGFDYDDDSEKKGYYKVGIGDHIGFRYEILKFLGSGTFGLVVLVKDWSQYPSKITAVKLMHFDEDEDYINREIDLMKYIEANALNKEYFSRMIASFSFRNHKCLVLELLGSSVDRHSLGEPVRNVTLLRQFAEDILRGMYYLHQMKIIHGDLKPDNIMYTYGKNNASSGPLLKIADFGIGCIEGTTDFECPDYYIQTRYYRSPEVILGLPFDTQTDIWSVGVILAEFYLGVPPFFGETETDQLAAMMEVLGLVPAYMVARSPRKKVYFNAICYTTENGFHRKPYRKPLKKVLKGMPVDLYDLIARCLEFDPRVRITAEQALHHPFIKAVYPPVGKQPLAFGMQRFMGNM